MYPCPLSQYHRPDHHDRTLRTALRPPKVPESRSARSLNVHWLVLRKTHMVERDAHTFKQPLTLVLVLPCHPYLPTCLSIHVLSSSFIRYSISNLPDDAFKLFTHTDFFRLFSFVFSLVPFLESFRQLITTVSPATKTAS